MQLTTENAGRILTKLAVELTQCKHHVRGFVCLDGRRLFPVHFSFGNKDLPGNVPHLFRRSLHLTLDEFEVLRGCSMTREQYFELLRRKGVIPPK
jgi:hypothetical protein